MCIDKTNISFNAISAVENNSLSDQHCCEEHLPSPENNKETNPSDCGCDIATVTYLKLVNHPGSETKLEYPVGKTLCIAYVPASIILLLENAAAEVKTLPPYSPPEKPYGRILISFLNQRKIALTA